MRNWETWVRRYLDLPVMADRRDQRIVAELAAHLEETWQEARARGASDDEADALALATLGDRQAALRDLLRAERYHTAAAAVRHVERTEDAWRGKGRLRSFLADVIRELRLTARALAKRPVFAAVVVFVLALGIGATTAIFTLVDAILLSPLPFPDADRLVTLAHSAPNVGRGDVGQCAAWHFTYVDENQVFEDLGMYSMGRVDVTGDAEPEALRSMGATAGVFRTLGLYPIIGRRFTPQDEDPDAPGVILLSHGLWQTRFGGDANIVGKTLLVDGQPREIVGVMPPTLVSLGQDPAVITPLRFRRSSLFVGNVGFSAVARLKRGVTRDQAMSDMRRMLPMAFEKFPGGPVIEAARQANYIPEARYLKDTLVGGVARVLWVLLAGVAILFLIACANVANLFLIRAEGKQKEMAIRTAMGASRRRVGWEYLKESLLLGVMGGLAGLGVAHAGLQALVALAPSELPRVNEVALSSSALLFTLAISVGAGVVLGAIPILKHDMRNMVESLKQGGHAGAGGRRRHRIQSVLAVSQLALVFVLLVASGLVVRSADALRKVDPGFRSPDTLLALSLRVGNRVVREPAAAALMQETIARRLGEIPGVDGVAMATALPIYPGDNINPLYVEGITAAGRTPPITRRHKWIGGDYFETLEIPVLTGRALTWQDAHDRMPAVVVSRSLAVAYWGSVEAAIGRRISVRPDPIRWHEVVGVVGDVHEDGVNQEPVPMVYWPQVAVAFWQGAPADELLVWRTAGYAIRSNRVGTPDFADEVRRAIWSVNPNLPLANVGTLSSFMAQSVARTTFALALLGIAAAMSLVLGVVGVYGVISYGVSQRTQELGMRMALGAGAGRVQTLVLWQGFGLAVLGVAVGLALALGVTRVMAGLLFGVSPTDPVTFAAVALGLAAVALVASYAPARRASRVDPMVVLRAE